MIKKSVMKIIVLLLLLHTTTSYCDWGKGNLTVSESSFYIERLERVFNNWFHISSELDRDADGRIIDTYKNFLVIDLDKQVLWIEDNGQILKEYYLEFPAGLKWSMYHSTPNENTELKGKTYLRIKGIDMNRLNPEMFFLVGQGRNTSYILLDFFYNSCHGDLCQGLYTFKPCQFNSVKNPEQLYGSLLVSDKEYQQYRNSFADSKILLSDKETSHSKSQSKIEENKAAWDRIEKNLYIEIERQVEKAGYGLSKLIVKPGPDFSAGHAEISAHNDSLIKSIFGRQSSVEAYIKIDYTGSDVWYAKSAANSQLPVTRRNLLDLEFLIIRDDKLTDKQRSDSIEKGRKIQQAIGVPESKWKVICSNGMSFEFLGICENPSFGKKWWGPDGSTIEYAPYINTESYGGNREDRKIYEIAWSIENRPTPGSERVSFENNLGSYFIQTFDKYGNLLKFNIKAMGYVFDKTLEKTTLTITITDGNGNKYNIIARNISLVPGQDQGFSIEVQE
jgi:hypothetical protein